MPLTLNNFRAATARVEVPREAIEDPDSIPEGENYFIVKGLNILDIGELISINGEILEDLWVEFASENTADGLDKLDFSGLARAFLARTPDVAAHVILLGMGERREDVEDALVSVAVLPASVQIIALGEIARLTFYSEEQVGKILSVFVQGSKGMKALIKFVGLQAVSTSGAEGSGKESAT